MRWFMSFCLSLGLSSSVWADEVADAEAIVAEILTRLADVSGVTIDDPDHLRRVLATDLQPFSDEADARGVQWATSYRMDFKASEVDRHDADGTPIPLDPATLEGEYLMPEPDDGCDPAIAYPLSEGSTADASWQRCGWFEADETGYYFIDFSELLYGRDGNYRWLRFGIALHSPDEAYVQEMAPSATALLNTLMDSVRAASVDD